jgi:hypothetical protein
LEIALRDDTPGHMTFYPGTDKTFAEFRESYPNAKLIQPEGGKIPNADFLLIEGAEEDGYAATHEAFCQFIGEIPLDTAPEAEAFLEKAVAFCNTKLMGTLGSCILIDDDSLKNHRNAVVQAVTDLEYGGISVNEMPPTVWNNPYLTWGGNEEGKEFVSGRGNFGNLLNFENVEKSIVWSSFMSTGHILNTHKQVLLDLSQHATNLAIEPPWREIGALAVVMLGSRLRYKDF